MKKRFTNKEQVMIEYYYTSIYPKETSFETDKQHIMDLLNSEEMIYNTQGVLEYRITSKIKHLALNSDMKMNYFDAFNHIMNNIFEKRRNFIKQFNIN